MQSPLIRPGSSQRLSASTSSLMGEKEPQDSSLPEEPPPHEAGVVDFADVSDHQRNIDWSAYAASGRKLAICKATEGDDWNDPTTGANRQALSSLGLYCGLYHFAGSTIAGAIDDPVVEADHFLSTVGTMGKKEFPVLDFERTWGMTPSQQVNWIKQWCTEVENQTGKVPWLYTNGMILRHINPSSLTRYPLWLANYQSHNPSHPPASAPWPGLTAWQYSDRVDVPGIGRADDSFFYGIPPSLTGAAASSPSAAASSPAAQAASPDPRQG